MNPFVLAWLGAAPHATRFLPRDPSPRGPRPRHIDGALVRALRASNQRWGLFVKDDLQRWQYGESVTIVAGQQVGFAGGPLYTLAKLATLVRMKRELERAGTPVTAFFWLATEDHDFDEVATLNVPVASLPREKEIDRQLDLVSMRAIRTTDSRAVVGSLPVPSSLATQLVALFDMQRPEWLREGVTFRDSFAELVASVFGNEVILVDALLPELRRAGASLFDQIVRRDGEIQDALHVRSRELEAAGFHEQIVPADGERYTLLYELDAHDSRQPPTPQRQPERTSTSALTRPLLQDFVLAPDIFVGGPAEVAYYAQLSTLHELLGIELPRIALRGHALVAPSRMARTMSRYAIDPAEIFTAPDELLAAREQEGVTDIQRISREAKRDLFARIEEIAQRALPADHSLARSIERSVGHLEYHFDKLAQRAIKGMVRKDRERYAAVRELVATLYPDRRVQDRVVGWFPFWREHGRHLVDRVVEEIEPDSDSFTIVTL
jgi:uncharacterized protein YllA (UPF0747 family)